ncbi:hypothetical protein [Pseudosulfitobacter pseudonitzschiae]
MSVDWETPEPRCTRASINSWIRTLAT